MASEMKMEMAIGAIAAMALVKVVARMPAPLEPHKVEWVVTESVLASLSAETSCTKGSDGVPTDKIALCLGLFNFVEPGKLPQTL